MFIGHFGIAFALKRIDQKISLLVLCIAVQLIDLLFFIFLFLGIENANIVPGFTEASPLDLYDYPITHSLVGALIWAMVAFLLFRFWAKMNNDIDVSTINRSGIIVGIAVFSHFVLDFIVHTPDLLLIPGVDIKIGLGLWNSLPLSIIVEVSILLLGGIMYLSSTKPIVDSNRKYVAPIFLVVLAILTVATPFLPLSDIISTAAIGLTLNILFSIIIYWIDRARRPITVSNT